MGAPALDGWRQNRRDGVERLCTHRDLERHASDQQREEKRHDPHIARVGAHRVHDAEDEDALVAPAIIAQVDAIRVELNEAC